MIKIFVIAEGTKITIDLESTDISVEDLKKEIEKHMNKNKVVPHDKQVVYINKRKLVNGTKLNDYVNDNDKEVKVFVLRETKNVLGSAKKTSSETKPVDLNNNPYISDQKNPFYMNNQMNSSGNVGQSPNQNMFQVPPMYGYPSSPQQGMGQFPQMGSPITKEQIDMICNNPQFLDPIINMQSPGLSNEEKEAKRNVYLDCFKMLRNDPSMINNLNSMAPDILRGGMGGPGMGFPQYQQPQYGNGYFPQQNMNHYPPQPQGYYPYYGYPGYGMPQQQFPQPPMSPSNYEKLYEPQLQALENMGFTNKTKNLDALVKSGGDINVALDFLNNEEAFKKN